MCFRYKAFYQGTSRIYSLSILVDGVIVVEDWVSSGTTDEFETVSLVGVSGGNIAIIASLEDGEFIDITEVSSASFSWVSSPIFLGARLQKYSIMANYRSSTQGGKKSVTKNENIDLMISFFYTLKLRRLKEAW